MPTSMIKTNHLTKMFGDFIAVDGVNLDIKKGEIFGLLGPNGAGKSTLISMLSMITMPTSGTAKIGKYDVLKNSDNVRKMIGIVFQDPSLDDRLTARENLELHAMLYGLDSETSRKRIDNVLKLVELEDRSGDLVRTYSGGMRRRLEIARGLIHYPKVLFLDEPTLGLDPQTREHIWDYIKSLVKRENITIVLTTHYMEEADMLCDRIGIIDSGKIIALDTPKKLKHMIGSDTIIVKVKDSDKNSVITKIKKAFPKSKAFDGKWVLYVKDAEKNIKDVFGAANKVGIDIIEASIHSPTLNDVFLHLTGKEIREEKASASDKMKYSRMMRGHG